MGQFFPLKPFTQVHIINIQQTINRSAPPAVINQNTYIQTFIMINAILLPNIFLRTNFYLRMSRVKLEKTPLSYNIDKPEIL